MKNIKGQIQLSLIFGAAALILTASGFIINKFVRQDEAIKVVETTRANVDNEQNQRIAITETNYKNLKESIDGLKEDMKDLKTYFGIKSKK